MEQTEPVQKTKTTPRSTSKVIYTARTHTTGGREGSSKTDDGRLEVKLSNPGGPGTGTNPEQLFAIGWSACFLGALNLMANKLKVRLSKESSIDAEVDLNMDGEDYLLSARLNINLPGLDRESGLRIIEGAKNTCPYSKAIKGNVDVEYKLM